MRLTCCLKRADSKDIAKSLSQQLLSGSQGLVRPGDGATELAVANHRIQVPQMIRANAPSGQEIGLTGILSDTGESLHLL